MRSEARRTAGPKTRGSPTLRRNGGPLAQARGSSLARLQRGLGNQVFGATLRPRPIQAKLKVGAPNDRFEQEADRVADQVMRMPLPAGEGLTGAPRGIQRSCAACAVGGAPCPQCSGEDEIQMKPLAAEITPLVQRRELVEEDDQEGTIQTKAAPGQRGALGGTVASSVASPLTGGQALSAGQRAFFEPRFGVDFSAVRIHQGAQAATAARSLGARAYTLGRDVVFGAGEYAPDSKNGQRLLAHELTHVVQQTAASPTAADSPVSGPTVERMTASPMLQRTVYDGQDHGGRYELDDQSCTLTYHQNWFFAFRTNQTRAQRQQYMEAARRQIQDVWSARFPLIPDGESCPCPTDGITVNVSMHPHERNRQGRGFSITVTQSERRGLTDPPGRRVELGTIHETPVLTRSGPTQQRIAHEFGHTIGLPDEYTGWARFFGNAGSQDIPSIMHSGDAVRPHHYQPFADLVNLEIGAGCTYSPAGQRQPALENPVNLFTGIPFTFLPQNADFVIGLNFDRRVSNEALLGLFSPTLGATTIWNPEDRSVLTGPTAGLRLNQLARPIYFNLRTGVLFDPSGSERALDLNIPVSVGVGIQREGFQVGVNYTAIADVLGSGGWTHLVGVGLQGNLPWERSRGRRGSR